MTKGKPADRQPPSCKECQRRKQKCSREWPCQQCISRKVPQLCAFSDKKKIPDLTDEGVRAQIIRKRSNADSDQSSGGSSGTAVEETSGLVSWGYMDGNPLFKLESVVLGGEATKTPEAPSLQPDELENVLRDVPTRTITDLLVQNYLYKANYRYYWIYPPTFSEQYADWWAGRKIRKNLNPDFTCLLLRMCAVSTQHLTDELRKQLEHEFAEDYETIGQRYFTAADKLHATLTPATSCLARGQQLMLKASWYKAEGRPLETWHAVGEGIRVAQELGMHDGIDSKGLEPFETEMRKRLWCTLYIWDWQMSAWLSRPLIIDHSTLKLELPTLQLEKSNETDKPSPFTHMERQAALIQTLSHRLRTFGDTPPYEKVMALQADIQEWMDTLPPAYSMVDPVTKWDDDGIYILLQRLQLHACAWMLKIDSYKAFLTKDPSPAAPEWENDFRIRGVDCALKLFEATSKLYAFEHPIGTKFHLVSFLLLDVGLLFCSAISHDKNFSLPRRQEMLSALENILEKFHLIGENVQSGKNAYSFLSKLVSLLKLAPGETVHSGNLIVQPSANGKRAKHDQEVGLSSTSNSNSPNSKVSGTTTSNGSGTGSGSAEQISVNSNEFQAVEGVAAWGPQQPAVLWPKTTPAVGVISDFEKHFNPVAALVPVAAAAAIPEYVPCIPAQIDTSAATVDFVQPSIGNIPMAGMEEIIAWGAYNLDPYELGADPNWLYDPQLQLDFFDPAQF